MAIRLNWTCTNSEEMCRDSPIIPGYPENPDSVSISNKKHHDGWGRDMSRLLVNWRIATKREWKNNYIVLFLTVWLSVTWLRIIITKRVFKMIDSSWLFRPGPRVCSSASRALLNIWCISCSRPVNEFCKAGTLKHFITVSPWHDMTWLSKLYFIMFKQKTVSVRRRL